MPSCALLSIVFMMSFVMVFDTMRFRHRVEAFASATGLWLAPLTRVASAPRLSAKERAVRLYAMGEFAAAAELLRDE